VLREEGVRIALDDVGYGRSSIEALLVLEPDVVKVDRSCVRGIDARPRERRRLERLLSIIRIGGALAIVEGVETEEELRVLRDIGVSHCQGYLWGEPRPAAAG
jgi:EAL domain-containing protein (putative c-di-GMP-specific phosphodiesterase class I)